MAPSTSSTLTRYRPAILVLTALAAGYTIYHVHSSFWSSESTISQPLVRRNAMHRRHHRRRNRRRTLSERPTCTSAQVLALFHDIMQHPERREFGEFETLVGDRRVFFPMHGEPFLTAEAIAAEFELSEEEAVDIQRQWEVAFLEALFASCLPSCPCLTDVGGVHAFVDAFAQQTGLSYAAVERAVANVNNGGIHGHPMRMWIREIEVRDAASIVRESTRRGVSPGFRVNPEIIGNGSSAELQQIERSDTVIDSESSHSWHGGDENDETRREGQNLLSLLYHIAEDQAKRDGYVHRGVSCNSCNTQPIRGIRYRCANCLDFDLCEQCEAMQIHPKTHVFYKVRIPAPFPGSARYIQPVWYPGRLIGPPQNLPHNMRIRFCKETGIEGHEVDALWEQFKCLAATEWNEDKDELGTAIDRQTFNKCFSSSTSTRPPAPNLIHERMFDYYDTDNNGLIGFGEFLAGLSNLKGKNHKEKLRKIFQGYDLDDDGYVSRKDMLRMFRAYYALTKELTRELVAGMEEDAVESTAQRDLVASSQPISSAFGGAIPLGEPSRIGEGKRQNAHGDYIPDTNGVLGEDDGDRGDYHDVVADVRERAFADMSCDRVFAEELPLDATEQQREEIEAQEAFAEFINGHEYPNGDITNPAHEYHTGDNHERQSILPTASWPDDYILPQDAENALGAPMPLEDVTEAEDRSKVRSVAKWRRFKDFKAQREAVRKAAVQDRWRRREFYLAEEDGVTTPDLFEEEAHPTIKRTQEPTDPIEARIKAIKYIRDSSLYKSFRLSIRDEIDRRHLSAQKDTDITALADLLIQLAGMDYERKILWHHIDRLGHKQDVNDFLDWFLDHIQSTYKDLRDRPAVANRGSSYKQAKRSRSSSKVRFEDDLTDAELETRSNTSMSSRSIPFGERWGAYEVPEPEKDLGREYLYQVTQEGLNELLDPMFKQREDLAMEIERTADERAHLRHALTRWSTKEKLKLVELQIGNLQKSWRQAENVPFYHGQGPTIGEEIQALIARSHDRSTNVYLHNVVDLWDVGMYRDGRVDFSADTNLLITNEMFDILDSNIRDFMTQQNSEVAEQSEEYHSDYETRSNAHSTSRLNPLGPPSSHSGSSHMTISDTACAQNAKKTSNGPTQLYSHTTSTTDLSDTNLPNAVLDLHNSVAAFHEADSSFEEKILQTPLEVLLDRSGYALADEPIPPEELVPPDSPAEPTLPHHRSSTSSALNMSPPTRPAPSLPTHEPLPRHAHTLPTTSRTASLSEEPNFEDQQFQDKLKFLAMLEAVRREDEERGGAGKLSLKEFEEIMEGPRGARLAFIGSWVHMATFWGSGL